MCGKGNMNPTKKIITVASLKRRKALIILVTTVIALALSSYFLLFCRVNEITVSGNTTIAEETIREAIRIKNGRHLFSINETKLENAVLAISPYVKSVHAERKLPSKLSITLEEYNADYYIIKDEKCYLLSDTLFVLEERPLSEIKNISAAHLTLPHTINEEKFAIGKTIQFEDKETDTYIKELLASFSASPISEAFTALSLDEKANITAMIGGKYYLKLGNSKEIEKKLSLAKGAVDYLSQHMAGVAGTLHAWSTEKVTFEITGVA